MARNWHAKPSGGYSLDTTAAKDNCKAAYDYLQPLGYTREAIVGIMANAAAESAMNPWRWEGDTVRYGYGYGLFQFTPAREYINHSGIPNHAPNLSVSSTTSGASPNDAKGQLYVVHHDTLGKWQPWNWRSYWDSSEYSGLYSMHSRILREWGSGGQLSRSQFRRITDYHDATFAFMACYEGPAVPNYYTRNSYAITIWNILKDYNGGGDDIFFFKRIIDIQFRKKFNVL